MRNPLLFIALVATSCAQGGSVPADTSSIVDTDPCEPGVERSCVCSDGTESTARCSDTGEGFGSCAGCDDPLGDGGNDAVEGPKKCLAAPSCSGAEIPPSVTPELADLNAKLRVMTALELESRLRENMISSPETWTLLLEVLGGVDVSPPSRDKAVLTKIFAQSPEATPALLRSIERLGVDNLTLAAAMFHGSAKKPLAGTVPLADDATDQCEPPKLRVRLKSITVNNPDDDIMDDVIYCTISAESPAGSELRLTPQTPELGDGDTHEYSLNSGSIWGQKGLRQPTGSLLITYDCFETDDWSQYTRLIQQLGEAAEAVGSTSAGDGEYGWVLDNGGTIASVVVSLLALDGDDHLLNAEQIVPAERHLELANGANWELQRDGDNLWSEWDWSLRMEAWGCADGKGAPTK